MKFLSFAVSLQLLRSSGLFSLVVKKGCRGSVEGHKSGSTEVETRSPYQIQITECLSLENGFGQICLPQDNSNKTTSVSTAVVYSFYIM